MPHTEPATPPSESQPPPEASARPAPGFLDSVEKVLLRIILVSLLVLGALLGFAAWHARHGGAPTPAPAADSTSITILVDFGDGSQRKLSGLPAAAGMTVLDAMSLARAHAHPIQSTVNGTGERALLTAIDGVASEGVEAGITKARCWQYWINSQYGQTSIGVATLHPGDRVTWAYRVYESDPKPPTP